MSKQNPAFSSDDLLVYQTSQQRDVSSGYYRHYKGGYYKVNGMSKNADDGVQGAKRVQYEGENGQRYDRAVEQWHKPVIHEGVLTVRYHKVDYVPEAFKPTMQAKVGSLGLGAWAEDVCLLLPELVMHKPVNPSRNSVCFVGGTHDGIVVNMSPPVESMALMSSSLVSHFEPVKQNLRIYPNEAGKPVEVYKFKEQTGNVYTYEFDHVED